MTGRSVNHLSKSFGALTVLHDIDFQVAAGEFLAECRAHETIIKAEPAIFFVDAKAPDARRAGLLMQLPRHGAGFVPIIAERGDFAGDKAAQTVAKGAALWPLAKPG